MVFWIRELVNENTFEVPVIDVFGDGLGDCGFVFFEGIDIAGTHFCGDFIAHMQELAEIGVVVRAGLVMAKGRGESLAVPFCNLFRPG